MATVTLVIFAFVRSGFELINYCRYVSFWGLLAAQYLINSEDYLFCGN